MAERKPLVLLDNNNLAELPAGDSLSWSLLSGVPVYATRWPTWDEVSGKPTAFPPAAHTHSASDITSGTLSDARLPSTMGGKTFTGAISAPSVALGSQAILLYESNSDGSFTIRTGPAGGPYGWFGFGADGNFRVLNDGAVYAQSFRNNSGASGAKYFVGDDVTLNDVNLANVLGVVGVQDPNHGYISYGNSGAGIAGFDGTSFIIKVRNASSGHVNNFSFVNDGRFIADSGGADFNGAVHGVRMLGGDVTTNTSNPVCGGRNGQSNWNSAGLESFCTDGGWAVVTLHRVGYSHVNLIHGGNESLHIGTDGNAGGVQLRANGEIWLGDANNRTNHRRQPRIFVQAGDPGAAAADGDIWIQP